MISSRKRLSKQPTFRVGRASTISHPRRIHLKENKHFDKKNYDSLVQIKFLLYLPPLNQEKTPINTKNT
jgi:hypothetical protein